MSTEKKIAKVFNLEGDNWLKHANPWSIWTRFATLPFIVLAIWSRVWIGWYCLIPIVLLVVWLKFNPILFKKPKKFDSWGSKSVLGEKYWAERKSTPISNHHKIMITILTFLQMVGVLVMSFGLWKLNISLTIIGTVIVYFAKMWFLDRMVWIYEGMENKKVN